jgi:hypothetical protein
MWIDIRVIGTEQGALHTPDRGFIEMGGEFKKTVRLIHPLHTIAGAHKATEPNLTLENRVTLSPQMYSLTAYNTSCQV